MGFFGKIKGLVNVSEEEYYDEIDDIDEEETEEEDSQDVRSSFSFNRKNERDGKVVDIRSGSATAQTSARAKVVINKLDRYEDVTTVADVINEKKIALLNLETCDRETAVRILDFVSGVAYANNATLRRTASRAYVITPPSVPLSGEIFEEIEHTNY